MHQNPRARYVPEAGRVLAPLHEPYQIPDAGDVVRVARITPASRAAGVLRPVGVEDMTVDWVSEDGRVIVATDAQGERVLSLIYQKRGPEHPDPNTWHWPHGHRAEPGA